MNPTLMNTGSEQPKLLTLHLKYDRQVKLITEPSQVKKLSYWMDWTSTYDKDKLLGLESTDGSVLFILLSEVSFFVVSHVETGTTGNGENSASS